MIVVAACMPGDEPPPASITSALSIGECTGMPVAAFVEDALANFAGVSIDETGEEEAIGILFDLIGLGSSAEGVWGLVTAVRGGALDEALWPSLAGLSPAVAESTIAAALIEIDPDFALYCGLLRGFGEGPHRTVTDLALLVNQSHGFPVSDEEMLAQPFERKSLLWEIATALDRVEGIRPPGGRNGVNAQPSTIVDSPVIQLLAAFRGAHNAFFGRERPWAHRPFGRPQHAFDKLVYSLGPERSDAGFIGPAGGELYGRGELAGVVLIIPAGAVEEDVFVEIHQETTGPMPPRGRVPVGPMVDLRPDGLSLQGTATLRLPYHPDLHRVLRTEETATHVARCDEGGGWEAIASVLREPGFVEASLSGFSLYQAMVEASELFYVESVSHDPDGILATGSVRGGSALYVTRTARETEMIWTEECVAFEPDRPEARWVPDAVRLLDPVFGALLDYVPVINGKARSVSSLREVGEGQEVIVAANTDYYTSGQIDGSLVMGMGLVYRVRAWAPDCFWPTPEVMAGGGDDFEGEGIPGSQVALGDVAGLAVDAEGNVYVAERIPVNPFITPFRHLSRVRKIEAAPPHRVTTVAGTLASEACENPPDEEVSVGTQTPLNFPWALSGLIQANGKLLFITDAMSNRVRAVNIDPAETVVLGGLAIAPGEIATVMGGGPEATGTQDKWALFGCHDSLPGGQIDWSTVSSPGGELARSFQLRLPAGVAVTDDALVVADTCTDRLLVMPLQSDFDQQLEHSGVPPPWLPVSVLAGPPFFPWDRGRDGPVALAGIGRPLGLSYDPEMALLWFGSGSAYENRLRRVRRLSPCDLLTCDDSPGTVCEGEVIRSYATTGTCHEEALHAYCTYEPIGEGMDCAEMGMACAGANGIARCVAPPAVVPPDELIGRALSSNLIESVSPAPGAVISAAGALEVEVRFVEPIDVSSFSLTEDLVATLETGGAGTTLDVSALFPAYSWSHSDDALCGPETDVLTLSMSVSLLSEGDVVRIAFLGEDERGDQVIRSAGDCPAGSGSAPLRLESRVSVRYRVQDAEAGVPGPPVVAAEPAGLVETQPDPLASAGPEFVAPHDRLLMRFSEPLASVTVSAGLLGEGDEEESLVFRAFRGLPDELGNAEHTGLVRDVSTGLLPGRVYRLEIQGAAAGGLPGTIDRSGEPLAGDGTIEGTPYVRYLRTSHVRIALPRAEPFVPTDLRYDPFIKEGLMALEVTEEARFVRPAGGLDFAEIDTSTLRYPTRPVVTDVSLVPDGSGMACVEAFTASNESLGVDCLRVLDDLALSTRAVVGPESVRVGLGAVRLAFSEGGEIEFEDILATRPPSLKVPSEVRLQRELNPANTSGDAAVLSIADRYAISVHGEELAGPAGLLWHVSILDPLVPEDVEDLRLFVMAEDGTPIPFLTQMTLGHGIAVALMRFSTIGVSLFPDMQALCTDGSAPRHICCDGQSLIPGEPVYMLCSGGGLACWPHSPQISLYSCETEMHACSSGCTAPCYISPTHWECSNEQISEGTPSCNECDVNTCTDLARAITDGRRSLQGAAVRNSCVRMSLQCAPQDGGHCCAIVGATPDLQSSTFVGNWPAPPNEQCAEMLEAYKQAVQNHEDQHVRIFEAYCNAMADVIASTPSVELHACGPNLDAAKERVRERAFMAAENHYFGMRFLDYLLDLVGVPLDFCDVCSE